jgi:molybdopterin/thiamine biosynthesis adenylyltransferase
MTAQPAQPNEMSRYNRQELIEGWDQKKLTNSTVTILGSDVLARYILMPLAALGVGRIRIIDNSKARDEMFLDLELKGDSRVKSLEEAIAKINPYVQVEAIHANVISDASKYFLEGSNIIIDATNSPRSKAIALDYCVGQSVPMIAAASRDYYGKIVQDKKERNDLQMLLHDFAERPQDEFVSMVMGGLVAEEVKKVLMGEKNQLVAPLYYNMRSEKRFTHDMKSRIKPRELGEFIDKKVLIVGAGALGNFVAMGLANMGVGSIDIMDYDIVEDTNLNRQVLYYDSVGRKKAEALAEKVSKIGRGIVKGKIIDDKFTPETTLKAKYDIIFDCVDNFTARAVMNDYAVKNRIPFISGGTDYQAGQVVVYAPGKTACAECQLNLKELAAKAEERMRQSCIYAPQPSVIMTNQVIGGMMVNEARTLFNPEKYGAPINGMLKYGTKLEYRLGVNFLEEPCACSDEPMAIKKSK